MCAATFPTFERGFADWLSGSAAASLDGGSMTALAAAGEVLPDGIGSAAIAKADVHCTDRDCAETAIANSSMNSSMNSRGFIGGLPERTLVRLTPIMERRANRDNPRVEVLQSPAVR